MKEGEKIIEEFILEGDSTITVLDSKDEVQRIKDSLQNDKGSHLDDNVILIPTKLPMKIMVGLLVNFLVLVIAGTATYIRLNDKLDNHEKQLTILMSKMTSKEQVDANIRHEVQLLEKRLADKKIEELQEELQKRNKQ